ncbi:MAG: hypothetical protein AAF844_04675 [Pseudomonadota bacterium]
MAFHPNALARVLIPIAMAQRTITYSELGVSLGRTGASPGLGLGSDLAKLEEWLKEHSLPPLTSLVVSKQTGRPSDEGSFGGVRFGDFSTEELDKLQQECFAYEWEAQQLKAIGVDPPQS